MRRGSNGVAPGRTERVPAELEMAALDDLGPRCRRAITEGALPTLAVSIVSQIVEINDKIEAQNIERAEKGMPLRPYLDPKDPQLDFNLARGVLENNFSLLVKDRSIEHAKMGLKPLVAKPTAHTLRERRRTEGRRFRGWR